MIRKIVCDVILCTKGSESEESDSSSEGDTEHEPSTEEETPEVKITCYRLYMLHQKLS